MVVTWWIVDFCVVLCCTIVCSYDFHAALCVITSDTFHKKLNGLIFADPIYCRVLNQTIYLWLNNMLLLLIIVIFCYSLLSYFVTHCHIFVIHYCHILLFITIHGRMDTASNSILQGLGFDSYCQSHVEV